MRYLQPFREPDAAGHEGRRLNSLVLQMYAIAERPSARHWPREWEFTQELIAHLSSYRVVEHADIQGAGTAERATIDQGEAVHAKSELKMVT